MEWANGATDKDRLLVHRIVSCQGDRYIDMRAAIGRPVAV